jgi:hypothetical protein
LLRHCATSRKVAGSIRNEVSRLFIRPNPSSRTMVLGSTQPLTEISTRCKQRSVHNADYLTDICELTVLMFHKPVELRRLLRGFLPCFQILFFLFAFVFHVGVFLFSPMNYFLRFDTHIQLHVPPVSCMTVVSVCRAETTKLNFFPVALQPNFGPWPPP